MMLLTVTGNVGADGEFKYSANGNGYLKFSVAVNTSERQSDGSWIQKTDWINVTVFGKQAENLNNNGKIVRGSRVVVSGRCGTRAYINKEGVAVASLDMTGSEVEVVSATTGSQQGKKADDDKDGDLDSLPF